MPVNSAHSQKPPLNAVNEHSHDHDALKHGSGVWLEAGLAMASACLLSQRTGDVEKQTLNHQFLGAGFDRTIGHLLPDILSHPSADVAFLGFFALAYSLTSFISLRHAHDHYQGIVFGLAGSSVILISFITNADRHFIILSYIPKAVLLSMAVSLGCHRLWRMLAQS